ncbi:hypothetical protein [Thauera humireducens]|uniref:hypothetical protein n=1 Tax=Thauera humireducens TaxID=1134435 RepID=UPI00311EC370
MTVGLDVGITGMRLVLLLLALMWVQLLLAQDIERKTVYFMLAYPYTRGQFLLSRFASIAILSAGATLVLAMALWFALRLANWNYVQITMPQLDYRYGLAMLGIWLDLLVVLAFAVLLCSVDHTFPALTDGPGIRIGGPRPGRDIRLPARQSPRRS